MKEKHKYTRTTKILYFIPKPSPCFGLIHGRYKIKTWRVGSQPFRNRYSQSLGTDFSKLSDS